MGDENTARRIWPWSISTTRCGSFAARSTRSCSAPDKPTRAITRSRKTREESSQKSLNKIINESQSTNEAQITLHNLESSAQTYRALYDNFLQRYMESVQQQSFPVSESRLITSATRPLSKSSPKALLVLALSTLGGLMLGAGIGMLRDISDRVFRTTGQVGEHLQADCISVVPLMKELPRPSASQRVKAARPPE